MGLEVGGIFGLMILILDIWAIVNIVQSGASTASKVLWIVLVILLPVVGLILWLLLGPRTARA
ncbi:MAG: PLD nuclease N-terminal domain-containing protein [Betaproteobacteria bacterium]